MSLNRVVITGLSAITPLGVGLEPSWENLLAGKSGIGPITRFDCSEFDCRICRRGQGLRTPEYLPQAGQAHGPLLPPGPWRLQDAPETPATRSPKRRPPGWAAWAVGLGGLDTIETFHTKLYESGPRRISPFTIPTLISNMAPGRSPSSAGSRAPTWCTTSACASGTHAMGTPTPTIKLGRAKAMICGGVESAITPLGVSGSTP